MRYEICTKLWSSCRKVVPTLIFHTVCTTMLSYYREGKKESERGGRKREIERVKESERKEKERDRDRMKERTHSEREVETSFHARNKSQIHQGDRGR